MPRNPKHNVEQFLALLDADTPSSRAEAAFLAGNVIDRLGGAVNRLVPLLDDPSPRVRDDTLSAILHNLGDLKSEGAARVLLLLMDPSEDLRRVAMQVLSGLGRDLVTQARDVLIASEAGAPIAAALQPLLAEWPPSAATLRRLLTSPDALQCRIAAAATSWAFSAPDDLLMLMRNHELPEIAHWVHQQR